MAERLTDIELESIHLHETKPRTLAQDLTNDNITQEDDVETACGPTHVMVQGDRSKPAIFTYHDIGLNSISNFQGFFNFSDMQPILKHFCVYHINAPGQHVKALTLPQGVLDTSGINKSESAHLLNTGSSEPLPPHLLKRASYTYPTMEQLAEMILPVMQFYGVKTFIGFGQGSGANILSRCALNHPDKVDGLVLINPVAGKSTWTEWSYQKANCWYLKSGQMTQGIQEYLLWYWFGSQTMRDNHDLVSMFAENMDTINPQNLAFLIESYIKRDDLGIERCVDYTRKDVYNFKCPVMLVAGAFSPHLEETVRMNGRLDPSNSTWIKFECGGMVIEEVPQKLTEAFRLFVQGMGYIPGYRPMNTRVSTTTSNSLLMTENNNKERKPPIQHAPAAAAAAASHKPAARGDEGGAAGGDNRINNAVC